MFNKGLNIRISMHGCQMGPFIINTFSSLSCGRYYYRLWHGTGGWYFYTTRSQCSVKRHQYSNAISDRWNTPGMGSSWQYLCDHAPLASSNCGRRCNECFWKGGQGKSCKKPSEPLAPFKTGGCWYGCWEIFIPWLLILSQILFSLLTLNMSQQYRKTAV